VNINSLNNKEYITEILLFKYLKELLKKEIKNLIPDIPSRETFGSLIKIIRIKV